MGVYRNALSTKELSIFAIGCWFNFYEMARMEIVELLNDPRDLQGAQPVVHLSDLHAIADISIPRPVQFMFLVQALRGYCSDPERPL